MRSVIYLMLVIVCVCEAKNTPNELRKMENILARIGEIFPNQWETNKYYYCATEIQKYVDSRYEYRIDGKEYSFCTKLITSYKDSLNRSKERFSPKNITINAPEVVNSNIFKSLSEISSDLDEIEVKIHSFDEMQTVIQSAITFAKNRLLNYELDQKKNDSISNAEERIIKQRQVITDVADSLSRVISINLDSCAGINQYVSWYSCLEDVLDKLDSLNFMFDTRSNSWRTNLPYKMDALLGARNLVQLPLTQRSSYDSLDAKIQYLYKERSEKINYKSGFANDILPLLDKCNETDNIAKSELCSTELAKAILASNKKIKVVIGKSIREGNEQYGPNIVVQSHELENDDIWSTKNVRGDLRKDSFYKHSRTGYVQCFDLHTPQKNYEKSYSELSVCVQFANNNDAASFDSKSIDSFECKLLGGFIYKGFNGHDIRLFCEK